MSRAFTVWFVSERRDYNGATTSLAADAADTAAATIPCSV